MAAENAAHAKVQPLEGTVLTESLKCILRTSWGKAAAWRSEGADAKLVKLYQHHKGKNKYVFQPLHFIAERTRVMQQKISS